MDNKFQKNMEDVFDITPMDEEEQPKPEKVDVTSADIETDYKYARGELYELIQKGQVAIEELLDVARSSNHPRAYEVAFQGIKNVADITDKLSDLHKKMNDLEKEDPKPVASGPNVQNNMFVGSTAELMKMLKENK